MEDGNMEAVARLNIIGYVIGRGARWELVLRSKTETTGWGNWEVGAKGEKSSLKVQYHQQRGY